MLIDFQPEAAPVESLVLPKWTIKRTQMLDWAFIADDNAHDSLMIDRSLMRHLEEITTKTH